MWDIHRNFECQMRSQMHWKVSAPLYLRKGGWAKEQYWQDLSLWGKKMILRLGGDEDAVISRYLKPDDLKGSNFSPYHHLSCHRQYNVFISSTTIEFLLILYCACHIVRECIEWIIVILYSNFIIFTLMHFLEGGAEDQTQGLLLARQTLYRLS